MLAYECVEEASSAEATGRGGYFDILTWCGVVVPLGSPVCYN